MKSPFFPFLLAAVVTILIGVGVWMEPYFAGDVELTRAFQAAAPNPGWWATPISRLAPAPAKYYVMVIALVLSYVVAGWRGLAIAGGFLALEQYGAESTKAIFARPRPSRELIAVTGNPERIHVPVHHHHVLLRHLRRRRRAGRVAPKGARPVADLRDRRRSCSCSAAPRAWRSARIGPATSAHVGDLPLVDLGDDPARAGKELIVTDWLWSIAFYTSVIFALVGAFGMIRPLRRVHRGKRRHALVMFLIGAAAAYAHLAEHAARALAAASGTASTNSRRRFISASSTRPRSPRRRRASSTPSAPCRQTRLRCSRRSRGSGGSGKPGPESIMNAPEHKPILDVATTSGFLLLQDRPPHEVVVGTVVVAPPGTRRPRRVRRG